MSPADSIPPTMTTAKLLLTAWEFETSINLGCVALLIVYLWKVRANAWQRVSFIAGLLVMAFALESPLDALGDDYLFSAHMAQHLFLILIVPPLLIFGLSETTVKSWLDVPVVARLERILGRPVVAWFSAITVMTLWHVPLFYNYALAHEDVHVLQHLSFLVTATMFWWPVFHPIRARRMPLGLSIFYLFTAVVENSALAITLTFMPVGHYPAYLHPHDEYGALSLIRNDWGLSPAGDQRLGGLLMWIPGCSVYFIAILGLLALWYSQPDLDEEDADFPEVESAAFAGYSERGER